MTITLTKGQGHRSKSRKFMLSKLMSLVYCTLVSGTGWHKKKQNSPKVLQLMKCYSVWNKNSIELCTSYVANICKVSTLYNKNSLFYSRSKICSRIAPRPSHRCYPELTLHLPDLNPPRLHSVVLPQGQGVWAQPPDHPWPQSSHHNSHQTHPERGGGNLARRIQVCLQRRGAHLDSHIFELL